MSNTEGLTIPIHPFEKGNHTMTTPIKKLMLAMAAAFTLCLGARAAITTEGLVAYYPFDGDTLDASGNGYNLSGSAATWTSDHEGHENLAASFNGSGYLTPSPIFNVSGSFTLAAWVRPVSKIPTGISETGSGTGGDPAVKANSIVFFPANGGYASQSGVGVCVGTNAVVVIEHRNNTVAPSLVWYGDIGEKWTHITITIESSGAPVLYVNGEYVKTGTNSGFVKKIGNPTNGTGNSVGTIAGGASWTSFKGAIDEIRIYSRVLDVEELAPLVKSWEGEGDGTEEDPYVVTNEEDMEKALEQGSELFVQLADGLTLEGPFTVPKRVASLTIDLNGGSITGATGQAAIVLAGDTAFTAKGTGSLSADDGIESVRRLGSVTIGSGVTATGLSGGGSVPAPAFAEGGASEIVKFAQAEGGKWTITAFAELGNASVGEEVTSGQVKVYAADTVDGLKTASALTEGVAIENKSAVKSTIQVTAPSGKDSQFFRVDFGE